MKRHIDLLARIPLKALAFALVFLFFSSAPVHACTIFVLTDTNQALFCNNEDWSETKTRIWFLPVTAIMALFMLASIMAGPKAG